MSDPVVGNGASFKPGAGLGLGTDGQPIGETRDELLVRLRSNLGWVSVQDQSIAVDLDGIIHKLEVLARDTMQAELARVTAERDAANADLWRIYKIVKNPMMAYSDEIRAMNDDAMRPVESTFDPTVLLVVPEQEIATEQLDTPPNV